MILHAQIGEEMERVKQEMEERGASMTDGGCLRQNYLNFHALIDGHGQYLDQILTLFAMAYNSDRAVYRS
jgi:hypothetical protein